MRSKKEIRRELGALLAMTLDERSEKSRRLCEAIAATEEWREARSVAIFAPQPREPDVETLWSHGPEKTFAYPCVVEDRLELFGVRSLHELAAGRFGVREPRAHLEHAIAPDALDMILVPGVAFTRGGERLGRGGGFYDRLLASLPARTCKIGVCYEVQVVSELPIEPHDQQVDFIATEIGVRAAR